MTGGSDAALGRVTTQQGEAEPRSSTSMPWRWPLAMVLGAATVAITAQFAVPLPFAPAPITFQILAVLLVGGLFGGAAGAGAMVLYLVLGAFGAPVFALGTSGLSVLLGPAGGYLLAFPLAAAMAGRIALRGSLVRSFFGCLVGMLTIEAAGLTQVLILQGRLDRATQLSIAPSLEAGLLEVVVASVLITWLHQALRPRV